MKQQLSFENLSLAQRKPAANNSSPEISAREAGLSVAEIGSLRSTLLCLFLALNVIAETIHFRQLLGRFRKSYARGEFFSL
jgi:hypothetical protein